MKEETAYKIAFAVAAILIVSFFVHERGERVRDKRETAVVKDSTKTLGRFSPLSEEEDVAYLNALDSNGIEEWQVNGFLDDLGWDVLYYTKGKLR